MVYPKKKIWITTQRISIGYSIRYPDLLVRERNGLLSRVTIIITIQIYYPEKEMDLYMAIQIYYSKDLYM